MLRSFQGYERLDKANMSRARAGQEPHNAEYLYTPMRLFSEPDKHGQIIILIFKILILTIIITTWNLLSLG